MQAVAGERRAVTVTAKVENFIMGVVVVVDIEWREEMRWGVGVWTVKRKQML